MGTGKTYFQGERDILFSTKREIHISWDRIKGEGTLVTGREKKVVLTEENIITKRECHGQ